MGGFSSSASTGGSGPAGRKSDGSYGTKEMQRKHQEETKLAQQ